MTSEEAASDETPFYRRLSLQIDGEQAASLGGPLDFAEEQRSDQISTPVAVKPRPNTPLSNVPKNRHASARVGTVFGGGGDLTAFKREWQQAQITSEDEEAAEEAAVAELAESAESPSVVVGELGEDEWDPRLGIRSTLAPSYASHHYQTVDEDLFGLDLDLTHAAFTRSSPRTQALRHSPSKSRLPPVLRAQARLDNLDIQRSDTSVLDPLEANQPSQPLQRLPAPLLRAEQLAELQQRAAAESQPAVPTQSILDAPMSWQMPEEESLVSARTLGHAASMPSLGVSTSHYVLPPSTAGLAYLDAAFQTPATVLSARSRYDQLVRACDQILPAAPPPPSLSHLGFAPPIALTQRQHLDRDLTAALHRQHSHDLSAISSSRSSHRNQPRAAASSSRPDSPTGSLNSFSYHRSRLSAHPFGDFGSTLPRGSGLASKSAEDGAAHMRTLKRRKKLRSEFLREIERVSRGANPQAQDRQPGLAALSAQENARIATHRKAAALLATNNANGSEAAREYSSAAIQAAQETRAADVAAPPAALIGLRLHSTKQASPAASKGHAYMRTHALHHHLTLPASASALARPSAAHVTEAVSLGQAGEPGLVAPPLPSKSAALRLQSPSVQAGWTPPSVGCMALSEQIYRATRSLHGLISAGEGRELLDRHLALIRPSHFLDDARQRSLAAAAIERMQAIAAEHKSRILKARLDAGASLLRARREARERRAQDKIDREAAMDALLKADLAAALSKLEAEEAASLAQQRAASLATEAAELSTGIGSPVVEEPASAVEEVAAEAEEEEGRAEDAASLEGGRTAAGSSRPSSSKPFPPEGEKRERAGRPASSAPAAPAAAAAATEGQKTPVVSPSRPSSGPSSPPLGASPLHRLKQHARTASVSSLVLDASARQGKTHAVKQYERAPSSGVGTPARTGSASSMHHFHLPRAEEPSIHNYSMHRVPRVVVRGSNFGPCGEDLSGAALVPPASYSAGHMLDVSVSASDERRTADERKLHAQADYTAVLARLYQPITPQQKRLRRLDQPKISHDDLRRVVAETLGARNPMTKRRFH